jgi:hypothetical protein
LEHAVILGMKELIYPNIFKKIIILMKDKDIDFESAYNFNYLKLNKTFICMDVENAV